MRQNQAVMDTTEAVFEGSDRRFMFIAHGSWKTAEEIYQALLGYYQTHF